jgi:hypothetical protein
VLLLRLSAGELTVLLLLLLLQSSAPKFGGFSFSKPAEPAPAPAAPAPAASSSFTAPPDPWKSTVRCVTKSNNTCNKLCNNSLMAAVAAQDPDTPVLCWYNSVTHNAAVAVPSAIC